jgi:YidC/Oxa1 family membrane protein insertase
VENQRNMILAVVLSALVLFGWSALSERYFPQPKPVPAVAGAPAGSVGAPALPAPAKVAQADAKAVLTQSPRVMIETPHLAGSINLKGATIDDLVLPTYKETVKKDSPPVRMFAPSGAKDAYFAGFGWSGDGLSAPGPDTVWSADQTKLTPTTPVTLSWANAAGQTFRIKIAVDTSYMFTVDQSVTNAGTGPVAARSYAFVSRDHVSTDPSAWTNHTGPIGVFNGAANYGVAFTDLDEAGAAGTRFSTKGGWLGFGDKYWLAAISPSADVQADTGFRAGNGSYQAEFALPPMILQPGKAMTTTTHLFAGAKEVAVLDGYQKALGLPLFGKAIDWGWFEILAKPFFYLLDWLFKLFGNFGLAIMAMTVIVRGAMFPIAQKQFGSMAAMRTVQPKMKVLQERYKDDKVKLQQEMMELYKREKVNPMAGCLPMILQIPIFYALYKVLSVSIEMRHQPFILWIKDLSAPDPAHFLNLFGLLNFTPPALLGIGVLALLLGVTMFLQFKLNPAPVDPAQAQMFAIMPWMMMFVMSSFASGLLLYWTTTNILVIAKQKWLYSRHPGLKTAPAT